MYIVLSILDLNTIDILANILVLTWTQIFWSFERTAVGSVSNIGNYVHLVLKKQVIIQKINVHENIKKLK